MSANEVVKKIMKDCGVSITALANRIGVDRAALGMRLRQKNVSVDKLNEMLKAIDYKIIVMPIDGRVKEDWFEI